MHISKGFHTFANPNNQNYNIMKTTLYFRILAAVLFSWLLLAGGLDAAAYENNCTVLLYQSSNLDYGYTSEYKPEEFHNPPYSFVINYGYPMRDDLWRLYDGDYRNVP